MSYALYLDWADLQRLEGVCVHQALLLEQDDVSVRILTVYGAKGLSLIVIASGMTTEGNGPSWSKVHFDEVLDRRSSSARPSRPSISTGWPNSKTRWTSSRSSVSLYVALPGPGITWC